MPQAMTQPAPDLPFTARERLRWRRAMDARLIDAIFGRVVRDDEPSAMPIVRLDRALDSVAAGR